RNSFAPGPGLPKKSSRHTPNPWRLQPPDSRLMNDRAHAPAWARRWGRSASRRRSAPAGLPRRSVGAICTRSRRRLEQPHALYLIAFVELFTQHLLLLTGLGDGALLHRAVAADQLRQRGDGHGGAVVGWFEL